jgi:DNA topoisomerase-3
VFERTRVETTVEEHVFRTSGRVLIVAGWRSVYGQEVEGEGKKDDDSGGDQMLPKLEADEIVSTLEVESLRKETQPPRRFTEASLLAAMETAGKEIEDADLREAMKDSGIGTPATRASIIERLIAVGYIEREGRSLHATEKGVQVIRLLGEHALTSPQLTGDWEHRLNKIEKGEDSRPAFMKDIAKFIGDTVEELDKLKGVKIERANLGPCPVCGKDVIENRKGYSCWSREDPGCGFVIWKQKARKNLPVSVAKELMQSLKESLERGDEPPIGRTEKQVPGFRGRSGRNFRAKLKIERREDDPTRWKVDFDEEWAKGEPPKEMEDDGVLEAQKAAAGNADGAEAEPAKAATG